MTDTLPSWATEKAREINRICGIPDYEPNVGIIAVYVLSAYQQGKQDGQREMKERAAKVADATLREYEDLDGPRQSVVAAIRRIDEGQDDAG